MKRRPRSSKAENQEPEFVADCAEMKQVVHRAKAFARSKSSILLLGERGTGKEELARRISDQSNRNPFVVVNCAELRGDTALSALFGHSKGAFTGAQRETTGLFEAAHGGTLFLDEIGKLPLDTQGLLLRAIQEGEIRRVGETKPRIVDVRVIAASNDDLNQMAEEGRFLRDLLDRLSALLVMLPPLSTRGDDCLKIAMSYLKTKQKRLDTSAKSFVLRYTWPGNIRQLRNVLKRAVLLTEGSTISADVLHAEIRSPYGPEHDERYLPPRTDIADTRRVLVLELLNSRFPRALTEAEIRQALGAPRQSTVEAIQALEGADLARKVPDSRPTKYACNERWYEDCCWSQDRSHALTRTDGVFRPIRRVKLSDLALPEPRDAGESAQQTDSREE